MTEKLNKIITIKTKSVHFVRLGRTRKKSHEIWKLNYSLCKKSEIKTQCYLQFLPFKVRATNNQGRRKEERAETKTKKKKNTVTESEDYPEPKKFQNEKRKQKQI